MPMQATNTFRCKRFKEALSKSSRRRHLRVRAVLGLVFFIGAGAVNAGELPADLGGRLTQAYILPAMQNFQQSASRLHASLKAWCAAPSDAGKQTVQEGFKSLVMSWSGIEFLRFGPLVANHRFERAYFWPDLRGLTLRQVQALLANSAGVPDASALSGHSVAVQGLPALEYLLYRDAGLLANQEGNSPACAYAISIAGNLQAIGAQLAQAWGDSGDYAVKFSQPSPSNSLYRSTNEVANEAIKAISTGLQFGRDVKLLPVLGADASRANYKRAPFWRSGLSSQSMAAAVDGILRFYRAGAYTYSVDEAWVDSSLQDELQRARDNFNGINGNVAQLANSPEMYRQLKLGALLLKNAKSMVDEDAAPALGVRIGFNALDGD